MSADSIEFMEKNPFWQWMGFRIDDQAAREGRAVVTMRVRAQFLQHQGLVHGGVISALIDSAGAWGFALKAHEPVRTINMAVQYLSPAQSTVKELFARASVVRAGRRIVISEVTVSAGPDEELTRGQVIYSRGRPR